VVTLQGIELDVQVDPLWVQASADVAFTRQGRNQEIKSHGCTWGLGVDGMTLRDLAEGELACLRDTLEGAGLRFANDEWDCLCAPALENALSEAGGLL